MSLVLVIAVVWSVPSNRAPPPAAEPSRVLPRAKKRVEITPRRGMLRRIQPRPIGAITDTADGDSAVQGARP